jgi:hypothetical protein
MVALMLVVLMAAVALAVDVGGLYLRRRELVNGADAAALAAARSCARGIGNDPGFVGPEDAADYQAQQNSPITDVEIGPMNAVLPPDGCLQPSQYGRVSVQYTSQQQLHFAPVLGFSNSSPVTTAATASWGLGSISQLLSGCPKPPPTGSKDEWTKPCGIWYDNDTLNNGNFGFLTLDPEGWNVPPGDNTNDCGGSVAGSDLLGDWISGALPASVTLNWTDPTYVCSISGLKGNSHPWDELVRLKGQIRNFPITWEGPGSPGFGAPPQGYVLHSGSILKYDVIGFAALRIGDVLTVAQANASNQTSQEPWPSSNYTYDSTAITLNAPLPSGSMVSYTWSGHQTNGQQQQSGGTCSFATSTITAAGPHTWVSFPGNGHGAGCPTNDVLDGPGRQPSAVTITYPVTTTGPCGPAPAGGGNGNGNSSARCLIVEWMGSTLTGDYTQPKDNITVIQLCDESLSNCLDQRHSALTP